MANALALPSSTGITADEKPAQVPKPIANPAAPKPAASPAPLALAGAMGGQSSTQTSAVPIPQTADPLAFAPSPTIAPSGPNTGTVNPTPSTPSAPTVTPADPNHQYDSLVGATPEQVNQYWATKLPMGTFGGGTTGLFGDQLTGKVGQAVARQNQTNYQDRAAASGVLDSARTAGASDLASRNTASAATNADQRLKDWEEQSSVIQGLGGIYPDKEKAKAEYLAGGAGAITPQAGTNLGSNTTVVPGFPGSTTPVPQDRPANSGDPVDTATAIANQATGGGGNHVALSQIDPENSLISQQITPGQNIDRVKTFQDALNSTRTNVLDPAFAAQRRDMNRYQFGQGRGVSGEARTSQGDITSDYNRILADKAAQGIADATRGSIDDNYRNIDETQQERDYQAGRADTAFNQDAELAQLKEMLTNGAFGRASAQQSAGYANSPEDIGLILSKIFGDQSSAAGKAAAESFRNAGSGGGGGGSSNSYADILALIQKLRGGGGGAAPTNDGGYEVTPE